LAKEVAQTVGGKRIAWLIAILAAFAVFATLGNQWGPEGAKATISNTTLTAVPADGSSVSTGQTILYTGSADSNAAAGDTVVLTIAAGAGQTIDGLPTCAPGGTPFFTPVTASCTFIKAGAGVINYTINASATVTDQPNGTPAAASTTTLTADDSDAGSENDTVTHTLLTPDLSIVKECSIDGGAFAVNCGPAQAGSSVGQYRVTVSNAAGAGDATGIHFVDEIDNRLDVTTADPNCVELMTNIITCDINTLAAGASTVIIYDFTVGPNDQVNAQITNSIDDVTADNITDTFATAAPAVFNLIQVFSASLTKIASPSSVTTTPVDQFDWIYQIVNTGTGTLTGWTLDDPTLDAGSPAVLAVVPGQTFTGSLSACVIAANSLHCEDNGVVGDPFAELAPGESITITVHMMTVAGGAPGNYFNDAVLDADQIPAVNSGGTVNVNNNPIITISKTVDRADVGFDPEGPDATFTITVTNLGAVPAVGVAVADVLPAGLEDAGTGTCALPANVNLDAAGGANDEFSCTIVVNLAAGSTPTAGSSFLNTASATFNLTTVTASASVAAAVPELSISKTATGSLRETGSTAAFHITITNTGTAPSGPINLVDDVDDRLIIDSVTGGACTIVSIEIGCDPTSGAGLAAGASVTVDIAVSVDPAADVPNGTVITNTAFASAPNTATVSDSASLTVQAPALTISKVASMDPVSTNPVFQPFAWYITVTNNGPIAATNVSVSDTLEADTSLSGTLPSGCTGTTTITCTVASLAPGAGITFAIPVAANTQLANGAVISNTATATCDNCPGSVSATANTTVQNNPQLTMTKTGPSTVVAGGTVTYTITINNTGGAASNVSLADTVPALLTGVTSSVANSAGTTVTCGALTAGVITCTGSVAAGGNSVITITGTVPLNTPTGTTFSNTAVLTAPGQPAITGTVVTTVLSSLLTVTKTNNPLVIGQNGVVTSTIIVTNNGAATVNGVRIVDTLPAGTTFVAAGSTAGCGAVGQVVTCPTVAADADGVPLNAGDSMTFTVAFNVGTTSGVICNSATTTNTSGFPNGSASACVTVVAQVTGAGLVHVDVDAASESAAHGETALDPNQVLHEGNNEANATRWHDADDATGSLHTVCLVSPDLGTNDQANIVWNITATPGSQATVSPAPAGTKVILSLDSPIVDTQANCVQWRSAGEGGQTITASNTVTGQTFYAFGTTSTPAVKEWNSLDSTKIVSVLGNVGAANLFGNTQDLASWSALATGGTCVRDNDLVTTDVNCLDRANEDDLLGGTETLIGGSIAVTGSAAGFVIATPAASFIDYTLGEHFGVVNPSLPEYTGPIDGAEQTYTLNPAGSGGTCGSARIENPVTGVTTLLDSNGEAVTVLSSDKGVGFQISSSNNGDPVVTIANADCLPNEATVIRIHTEEEVQLRSDLDTTPDEAIVIRWTVAPPPAKQVLVAWAGQRVILEHDWRIGPVGGNDVPDSGDAGSVVDPSASTTCPVAANPFTVHYVRGGGPGNFLPTQSVNIIGNDDATVEVNNGVNQQTDYNTPADANTACISRVLYESEDPGQVDIEAFIDEGGLNLSKVAFVIYYMKFEDVVLSIVDDVSKPTHNGPDNAGNTEDSLPGTNGDYAPGNPWDKSADVTSYSSNVSKDVLVRGRVRGWFVNANPSGRARDASNPLNVLPADRWVLPDDWALLAGGPAGEEAFGTAEQFRPEYDLMIAPNSARKLACDRVVGGCAERVAVTGALIYCDVPGVECVGNPAVVEGPYSLIDARNGGDLGPKGVGGAAVANRLTLVRNTILLDLDVDWWDTPMPPALVTADIRGSGFIKQVRKQDVYWVSQVIPQTNVGAVANANNAPCVTTWACQDYPNQFYWTNIPDSAFIPPVVAGGGWFWNSWGIGGAAQGPYNFWWALPQFLGVNKPIGSPFPVQANTNPSGFGDPTIDTAAEANELWDIRGVYAGASANPAEGLSIGRTLVVYSDNHGEFMFSANGDFNLTFDDCTNNAGISVGHECAQGDLVGKSNIYATVDYPDFRGKHFPVKTIADVTINWIWGGYKEVTIEDGETDFVKYVVFHALDRDGFCAIPAGAVSLHPVLSSADALNKVGANDPIENVDFLVDAGEGIITDTSAGQTAHFGNPGPWNGLGTGPHFVAPNLAHLEPRINDGRQFANEIPTFNTGASVVDKDFPRLHGSVEECQAWIKVSNTLLGILNLLVIAHDDEGDIGFDRIVDFQDEATYELTFRWSLITWAGEDGISPAEALMGNDPPATDITDDVTAIYGWNQSAQEWEGYFPAGVGVPGANDLTALRTGQAYWIAIKGPGNVTWTIATDVD